MQSWESNDGPCSKTPGNFRIKEYFFSARPGSPFSAGKRALKPTGQQPTARSYQRFVYAATTILYVYIINFYHIYGNTLFDIKAPKALGGFYERGKRESKAPPFQPACTEEESYHFLSYFPLLRELVSSPDGKATKG